MVAYFAGVKARTEIDFLYTNIGRGHPFYLDGLRERVSSSLTEQSLMSTGDVFDISCDLSSLAWKAARWLYRNGSGSRLIGPLYEWVRSKNGSNGASACASLLGRDLRRWARRRDGLLVVAHPILVEVFRGRPGLIYQHGELVAPAEALVSGAEQVLVPTAEVAQRFVDVGYDDRQVHVTGLCVESGLVASAADSHHKRRQRLRGDGPLTGLFVSSGAEPKPHIRQIVAGVRSVVESGGRAVVVARRGGRLARTVSGLDGVQGVDVHLFEDRPQEAQLGEQLVPAADFLVAPAHERTNWAVGLGLPIFVLTPTIGSFAPLNLELIEHLEVGEPLADPGAAMALGARVNQLRSEGILARRVDRRWGRSEFDGFERGAEFLQRLLESN